MVDVILSYEDADAVVAKTCAAAFAREGWSIVLSDGASAESPRVAKAHVVIWTRSSVTSVRLADENRTPLAEGRLLQLLVQDPRSPRETRTRRNVVIPPEPFRAYQGLLVDPKDVDGSDRAINAFAVSGSDAEIILQHLARIGGLPRPRDTWDAKVSFLHPDDGIPETVIVSEYAASDGRLLMRDKIDRWSPFQSPYSTTVGNRWQVSIERRGDVVTDLVVIEGDNRVDLPSRAAWWRRLLGR